MLDLPVLPKNAPVAGGACVDTAPGSMTHVHTSKSSLSTSSAKKGKAAKPPVPEHQSPAPAAPRIGVFGWIFGDKEHIGQNVATMVACVFSALLVAACLGVTSVGSAVAVGSLVAGLTTVVRTMLRAPLR